MTLCVALLFVIFLLLLQDVESIYPLLDHHGKSRYSVHSACMEALKAKLLQKLETAAMDDKR